MTRYLLLFTGLLSALSPSSHSLSCIQCMNLEGDSCTAPTQTCPKPDQICRSVYMLTSGDGIPESQTFLRECGDRATCHLSGTLSVPNERIQSSATCCNSDGCTPEKPVLPPISNEKNGVSCQSCRSTGEGSCQSSDYIQCVGEEVKCFKQSQTIKGSEWTKKSSMRGCTTKTNCNISHAEGSIGDMTVTTDFTCSDRCTGLHYSLSPLLLTIGLIIKVLH
ncbi:phospholipase A2 inhibitor and Ly6/PLAUR domain-containing protein-like isoform X2 [Rana temporaria]|uniref:phospholipase A2 inhibitor and Ly6/PLAUR domain-containing protein-like isoform X2 n=1 Tax=Rana temporaria TaxID=8407 RepID=UPI001AAD423D|nr:phospholipase A2 inhibitor and Ly6/PLAUR domain-containing protein-like isoform X2 [Rana temporaria]